MAAAPWRRCSSTSCGAAARCEPPRHDETHPPASPALGAAGQRHGAALLVSVALVMAPTARAHLLARGADADVGIPAALYRRQCEFLCPGERHLYRRGVALGHLVPRANRVFHFVSRGDVG